MESGEEGLRQINLQALLECRSLIKLIRSLLKRGGGLHASERASLGQRNTIQILKTSLASMFLEPKVRK